MESPLKTVVLEGIFFKEGASELSVQTDGGPILSVEFELDALRGRQVQLALMHVPPLGVQAGEWGLGSCQWRGSGHCPAGHHLNPDHLLVFSQAGSLDKTQDGWVLSQFDGGKKRVPFQFLVGHYGRVVAATTDAVERMRDTILKLDPQQQVEAFAGQAGELREVLDRILKVTGSP